MKKFLFLFIFSSCCTTEPKLVPISSLEASVVFPRNSAVKIEKRINITKCEEPTKCVTGDILMMGSGAVVKNCKSYSLILTANHVCEKDRIPPMGLAVTINSAKFVTIGLNGDIFPETEIIAQDGGLDTCVVKTKSLAAPVVAISPSAPVPGSIAYNISAPAGIFGKDMVFITNGYYLGQYRGVDAYSIYAYGGSSGSMVINREGKIIGMIHSVSRDVNHVSFSPPYGDLKRFLAKNILSCAD